MGLLYRLGSRPARLKGMGLFIPLFALAFTLALLPARAEAKYASLVLNADTGEILHEVNANTRNYPASLTKMMTLYLTFEAVKSGRLSMDDRLRFSKRAARQPSSKLAVGAGNSISIGTAIEALAVKSANDVASAMAEKLGKTERKFAQMMTATARRLGMSRTTFRNASGLPHRAQMSTARDMATLAQALIRDYPDYYHYFSQRSFTYKGRTYRNTNKLLRTYRGADGFKTGYIRASGFNLVTSAKRNNQRLISVVFGARTSRARNVHMARLLNKGFRSLSVQTIAKAASAPPRKPNDIPAAKKWTATVSVAKAAPKKTIATKTTRDTWGIQVGAYKRYDPALEMAKKVARLAPQHLADGHVTVTPLKKRNGRALYRARIVGIGKRDAYRACRVVKKKRIGCMELRLTGGAAELASAN